MEDGSADYALGPPTYFVDNATRLARRFGVNKGQFFVVPVPGVRMFALNASKPGETVTAVLLRDGKELRLSVTFEEGRRERR